MEGKAKYKQRMIDLTQDLKEVKEDLQQAADELERLDKVIEKGRSCLCPTCSDQR